MAVGYRTRSASSPLQLLCSFISILSLDSKTRTEDYVENLTLNKASHFVTTGQDETDVSNDVYPCTLPPLAHSIHHEHNQSALNPYAQSYNPTFHMGVDQGKRPVLHPATHESTLMTDFTRFLLKKDCLLSQLTNFNDKPESYQTWKASFRSIMADLNVTPRDEMGLLEKWSGPKSRKHIISLKASNYRFPERGLHRIWELLEERYGTPEMIEASLKQRLAAFPRLTPKYTKKLFELTDLVSEIESLKEDDQFKSVLGYFDSSTGVSPIVSKLPYNLHEKWTNSAVNYTKSHKVTYPPFSNFSQFLRDLNKVKNNPSFLYNPSSSSSSGTSGAKNQWYFQNKNPVSVRKTNTENVQESADKRNFCFLHNVGTHTFNKCKTFLSKSIEDRRQFLRAKKICFRCVESTSHFSRDCSGRQPCSECGSNKHCSALHIQDFVSRQSTVRSSENGGESRSEAANTTSVDVNCTQNCGSKFSGKSYAKIDLVDVFHMDQPETRVRLYAMIDDQSNVSLARSELFDQLKIQGKHKDYMLSSLSDISKTSGRDTRKIVFESVDRSVRLNIPILLECDQVPEIRDEIPTRAVTGSYAHLHDIAEHIPPIDNTARISMLLGRDTISAHHVLDQRIGQQNTPYAQKLPLGWVIIGETCLGRTHIPDLTNACKTNLLMDGRPSLFRPCPNEFAVRDTSADKSVGSGQASQALA